MRTPVDVEQDERGGILARWYEFQDLRFTRNQLWTRLAAQRRRLNLPPFNFTPKTRPVYTTVVSARRVAHLASRPSVRGGAGQPNLEAMLSGTKVRGRRVPYPTRGTVSGVAALEGLPMVCQWTSRQITELRGAG